MTPAPQKTRLLPDSQALQSCISGICLVLDQLAEVAEKLLQRALLASSSDAETPLVRRIREDYRAWQRCYQLVERGPQEQRATRQPPGPRAFAEQASYVCFIRLLLARVLEDKGIMPSMTERVEQTPLVLMGSEQPETALQHIYHFLTGSLRHFFQGGVFDWFQADETLQQLLLVHLRQYDFKDISNDLLGFTYEAFIERSARKQKGHFLTHPDIVEFMLERAGYTGPAIVGAQVLDMSCGSGSFLIHAARRLRQEIQLTKTADSPPVRARLFLQLVRETLVGLEINPFSCYLAELNLFLQLLDDLVLLWSAGESVAVERLAIYHTDSLEMPVSVLEERVQEASDGEAGTGRLDQAAALKTRGQAFRYILCNSPYINRGIVRSTRRYSQYAFYREIVRGDENFYLFFLRLATYYIAPGGVICFICPLNLLGDESTMRAREMFNQTNIWRLRSITRFYTRTVLFPGVLQGICVLRIDRQPVPAEETIELRGGFSPQEAERHVTAIPYPQVTANYPARPSWSKPWLVNTDPLVYEIWAGIRQQMPGELGALIEHKLHIAKGDVRSTWARPLKTTVPGRARVALTKGSRIDDWGGWSAEASLDPSITIPRTVDYYTSSLWVQKNIQRVAHLAQPETVLLFKEIAGLEARRPIRGTLIQRSAAHPVVADETLVVLYTLDPRYHELALAVFGFMTSALANFLFSLFSTNAHANLNEFLRLPVPDWSAEVEQQLAGLTRQVLQAHQAFYAHKKRYGTGQGEQVDRATILEVSGLPTLRLEELLQRGEMVLAGQATRPLHTLLKQGKLTFAPALNPDAQTAIAQLLSAYPTLSYVRGGKALRLPSPEVATTFLSLVEQSQQERLRQQEHVTRQQEILDEHVLQLCHIHLPAWKTVIYAGVPWARR